MKDLDDMSTDELQSEIKSRLGNFKRNKGYAFISYSKKDGKDVYKAVLDWMRQGYNIYLDMDFGNHGSEENWVSQMEDKIRDRMCKMAVVFKSEHYCFSYATLIEMLTMRSEETIKERASAENKVLPIDIIALPNQLKGYEISEEQDDNYMKAFEGVSSKHGDLFLSQNDVAKKLLEEGIRSLSKKLKSEDLEISFELINKSYKRGYTNFYPEIARVMDKCFNRNDLNGNNKRLSDLDGVIARFKTLGIYCKPAEEKVDTPKPVKEETPVVAVPKQEEAPVVAVPKQEETPIVVAPKQEEPTESKEKKHKAVNVKVGGVIPEIKSYHVKINGDMTLSEFESLFEDVSFVLYIRFLRANGGKTYSKQIVDYLMAAILRGCDKKAEENSARWKYSTYAVAKNVDMNNPTLGASQFTWQSNARKAINIEGSGKLGDNSLIFEKLSKDLTLGDIEQMFKDKKEGFDTKDNAMIECFFEALYKTV